MARTKRRGKEVIEKKKEVHQKAWAPSNLVLLALYAVRIVVCLAPQHGYIQPDEFFQFTEPIARDVLSVKSYLPWEFTQEAPLRSIFMPEIIAGTSFKLVKLIEAGMEITSPWLTLVLPRLFITMLSFVCDFSISRAMISLKSTDTARRLAMFAFASSSVSLVYLTHTFTNSVETILFSILVALCLEKSTFTHYITGCIIASGFFNRPTFLVFACIPVLLSLKNAKSFTHLTANLIAIGVSFTFMATLLAVFDTLYYNSIEVFELTFDKLREVIFSKLVLTPLNFLDYNSKAANLENHGLHPWYLHSIVSIPLISTVLSLYLYLDVAKMAYKFLQLNVNFVKSNKFFMVSSVLIPLAVLSSVPHQEPRFLLPCLIPLVMLYGSKLSNTKVRALWLINSLVLTLIYGFVHQAGVTRALFKLHDDIRVDNASEQSIIFSRMYLPPQHLLRVDLDDEKTQIYDLSIDQFPSSVSQRLEKLMATNRTKTIYIAVPSCYDSQVRSLLHNPGITEYSVRHQLFPHFQAEDIDCIVTELLLSGNIRQAMSLSVWRALT
ncbi:GPI mannosyltransferase 4 [Halotydeus destructor]|nr:GPI mannosyltransferase 4 [Halotydeus destructor]